MYRGDIRLGDTIDLKFTTVNTSGVPTTLAGSPTIAAYPDNSTTEVTAGITLTVDFDSRTGLHNVRVVATGGNGYAAGNYDLVITAGTVGGSSVVGYVVGSFSIEKRSAVMPATAGRTLTIDSGGAGDANVTKVNASAINNLISGRVDANAQVVADKTSYALSTADKDAIIDLVWDEGRSAHVADGSMGQAMQLVRSGTAQAGAAGSITLDTGASATDNIYNDLAVDIIGGTGVGQSRLASGYVGSSKVLSVVPNWTTNPDSTSVFRLRHATRSDVALWLGAVVNALISGRVDVDIRAIQGNIDSPPRLDRAGRNIVLGTVTTGATTTSIPTSSLVPAAGVTDQFKGRILIFDKDTTSVNLRGQGTDITASTAGGTLTVTALTTAPTSGDTFTIQ